MTAVLRATRVELLKLRRTLALAVAVATPVAALGMLGLNVYSRGPAAHLPGPDPWRSLLDNFALWLWCRLAYPLLVALITALLAGMEHGEGHWTRLFALPAPRWSVYAAKLAAGALLLALSCAVLAAGVGLLGLALGAVRPGLGLGAPAPWGAIWGQVAAVYVGSLLLLTVQAWLALRWPSFVLACGVGIAGTVVALILSFSSSRGPAPLAAFFPWAMPALAAPVPPVAHGDPTVAAGSAGAAVLVGALGCWDLARRDVGS